jgi:NAD(P)-dependent dehydrogenase (short-subunit alcohol dehydrogenase family)
MKRLAGKTAVVTGGGTGIGLGVALALAAEGCRVAIVGRRPEKLAEAAAGWRGDPPLARCVADVADADSVRELFAWADAELGPIDMLVQSAGVNVPKRALAELSASDWDYLLRVNATGAFLCLQAVLPQMLARRDGIIVNISSIAGKRSSLLGGVGYTAAKFAMSALGLTAAREVREFGVRITNVYPGEVDTPILEQRPEPVSDEHRARILKPSDVAEIVLAVICLPPRAHVPELIIKPTTQDYA